MSIPLNPDLVPFIYGEAKSRDIREYLGLFWATKSHHRLKSTDLGEASTKEIAVNRNAHGFDENKTAATLGGKIAGNARLQLEQESGKPVVSKENFLESLTSIGIEMEEPVDE